VIFKPGHEFNETANDVRAVQKISQIWLKIRALINEKNKLIPHNAKSFFWRLVA
jgi:hypothetical protein